MFKSKRSKKAAAAATVEVLPVIPALDAVEGSEIRTEDDDVHDAAHAHAVALLASRDPLTSPDPKYKFSNQRALAGDAVAIEMGLPHLCDETLFDVAACNGLTATDWVASADATTRAKEPVVEAPLTEETPANVPVPVPVVVGVEPEDEALEDAAVASAVVGEEAPVDEEPEWENLTPEEGDTEMGDGFNVLRDLAAVLDSEDVDAETLAATLAAEAAVEVEDEVVPSWQETVLPEPTEEDVKATQSLLEEIGVYFGDDLPEMPPFEHAQPQRPQD